ncbi:MAG: hypothetical protein SGJ03_06605 [Alphaproteobacteria bacterium]|nr:hypothetical protein [Alphaproteobacteria bacterium]
MTFVRGLKMSDQLMRRWVEEPIGIAVPLGAFFAVWLPPQMPDMFAGMEVPIWKLTISARPFLFALAAALLGLSAWFWTRAALTAQRDQGEIDKNRIKRVKQSRAGEPEDQVTKTPRLLHVRGEDYAGWSYEWAPRFALLAAGGITLLPILFSIASGRIMLSLVGAELLSFGLVGLLFVFVIYRTEFRWMNAFGAPGWMSKFRATKILACSPFGWPFAVLSLACSFAALVCVAARPGWVAEIDAPTTAIASLAFAVGPLVIALAVFRGLTERGIYFIRWIVHRAEPRQLLPGEAHRVKRLSNALGALAMLVWFLSPPWMIEKHLVPLSTARVIEPAGAGDCEVLTGQDSSQTLCRPDLRRALVTWAEARRRISGGGARRLPVVIVAAEGGASRAAVWLLSAMRMLDTQTGGDFGRHLFAISGVSGGSLGAATYARLLSAKGTHDGTLDWEDPGVREALQSIATADLLSASLSTYFMSDMFGSLVGPLWTWSGVPDRNAALESTFSALWEKSDAYKLPPSLSPGFLGIRAKRSSAMAMPSELIPLLLLNGTDVNSGERIITSSIRLTSDRELFPDSGDFLRLASRDIDLATAVTNSARFPFVSPAGRFLSPTEARDYQIIDGGYFENYGARTAWELARAIEDLNAADPSLNVVPIIVVVSNDLDADQPPRAKGGRCRTQLGDTTEDGSQVTIRCDETMADESCIEIIQAGASGAFSSQDQSIVPQSLAPFLGLAATRTAHGRDALHIVKRDFCRAQTSAPGDPRVRMIHIAMPKPDRNKGEAAPMNWVLNPDACDYMLNTAPWFDFNTGQARRLKSTLDAVLGSSPRAAPRPRPVVINCNAS